MQLHSGELDARPLVPIVEERIDAGGDQLAVEIVGHGRGLSIIGAEIDQPDPEGCHGLGPLDAALVVKGLDQGAHETRDADTVGAPLDRHLVALGAHHQGLQGLGVFLAEMEDVADLDAAARPQAVGRHRAGRRVVLVVRRGIEGLQPLDVEIGCCEVDLLEGLVVEDLALARRGQDLELVAHVAADRAGLGLHRHRGEAHPVEGSEIGQEHQVVAALGALMVEIEGIGVLHQELAAAHDAEARADLVPELPLDVVEIERQLTVAVDVAPEDVGDDLLVRRAEEHVALLTVPDAQHLLAVGLVPPALPPEIRRLDRRHQDLDGPGRVHLLPHDLLDLLQHGEAERQPAVDASRELLDHAGPQHELVRDDLGLGRRLLEDGQEVAGEAHPGSGAGLRSGAI